MNFSRIFLTFFQRSIGAGSGSSRSAPAVGTDARQIIGKGGSYTGINIDQGSTDATTTALRVFSVLGIGMQGDATSLDFADDTFDVVYSFGVLHHIPEAARAVAEIHRVLKPGSELLVMLYNRTSINYVVEIMFLRKLGLRILSAPGAIALLWRMGFPNKKLERNKVLHRQLKRMTDQEWLSRNMDGPDNPYSRVYGAKEAAELLKAFRIEDNEAYRSPTLGRARGPGAGERAQGTGPAVGLAPHRLREKKLGPNIATTSRRSTTAGLMTKRFRKDSYSACPLTTCESN